MKEKTQLKERSPSQQEQSIKETNTIGLQFNYLIPSMGKSIIVCVSDCVIQLTDNLDCLSDVQVAEKKLFLVQGDKPQLMNWEQFGLRIGIEEDSLLSSETVEVATAALVGGQFKFPKNTVLVSAVYAVSVSEPLLKPLRLEMQHCVDLRGRPGLSQYLKFAIAPVSTPSLPYQFSLVEGGEFTSNCWYGAINRKDFCLVCILGLIMVTTIITTGGGGGGEGGGGGGGGQQVQQLQAGGGQDQGGQAQQHQQQQGGHQQQPGEEGQGQPGGGGGGGGSQSSQAQQQGQELVQQEHHQLQVVQDHQQGGPGAQDQVQGVQAQQQGGGIQQQRVQQIEVGGDQEQKPQASGGLQDQPERDKEQQHVSKEEHTSIPAEQQQILAKELPGDEKKQERDQQLQASTPNTTG